MLLFSTVQLLLATVSKSALLDPGIEHLQYQQIHEPTFLSTRLLSYGRIDV